MSFRPPAVPLVTVDPYFSVWSMADRLYDDYTRHWTSKKNSMTGILMIDDVPWRFMGKVGLNTSNGYTNPEPEAMKQTKVVVEPLSTTYEFETDKIKLEVKFMTPLLMDNLDIMSRPVSYIHFKVTSLDHKSHSVKLYFDVTGEWCTNMPEQEVIWGREEISSNFHAMYMGTKEQNVLKQFGDDLRIDWGYFYLAFSQTKSTKTCITSHTVREDFINQGTIKEKDDELKSRSLNDDMPVMAIEVFFNNVNHEEQDYLITLAYDDIHAIEYFGTPLNAYWKRNGATIQQVISQAFNEYDLLNKQCETFNKTLLIDAKKSGGKDYAIMLALAYRQAIAAHKLVLDEDEQPLFISKECFSNGCMATVDVSYPSIPIFLLYNPELVKAMLRPIFKFSNSPHWKYDFAPHDIGTYPKANGQTYGLIDFEVPNNYDPTKGYKLSMQMPVEECGNMIIMITAVCLAEGTADFAKANWTLLTKWLDYLLKFGQDPGEQLCTDDFAGHLSHNTNLSIKAIVGIGAYSILCQMLELEGESKKYYHKAKEMANHWEVAANDKDHYRLTFDGENTWSLKYNMVWDILFDLNLFDNSIREKEVAYYLKKQNDYGVPLDSRKQYTKTDWLLWSATMADKKEDFEHLIHPIIKYLNETPSRTPFTDWYGTIDRLQRGFQNRTVIGGLFIKLLKDKGFSNIK